LLKLSNIYLKVLVITFLTLLIIVGVESYFYTKNLYFSNIDVSSLTTQELNQKMKYFQVKFTEFIIINIIILSVFIGILFYFVRKINNNLENEVNNILIFLTKLTKKKKEKKIESNFSEEFSKITSLLSKISNILAKHEKDYKSTIEKLEFSNTQKDEIISAISHEFKNPIAVINGYSETLLKNDVPPAIRKKFLDKIKKNGEKLTTLIDTLRLSIRLEENSQKIDFISVNLYEFSKEIIEDIKDIYPNREILLEGKNINILIDKMLFGVVLTNLIENAIKYSKDTIIVKITENYISVIDKGIGIQKEEIIKITDKFYRVSNNSWNNSLGLGLSIVNNILKLHNFKLDIISEYGKGSEFRISF
jgi:signal transduction histidine kinase